MTNPASARRGSFTAHSVDREHVAGRAPHHVLGDAPLDEALEEALAAHADDDQVDVALLRQLDDRLRGLAACLRRARPRARAGPGLRRACSSRSVS